MKRKTVLFILIAALLAFAVHAADTVNIRLDELGMSLDVPADCSVFTRNMSPDDPALAEYGIDLEQMDQLMAERNIYLDLLSDDPAYEGLVTMMPNVVENMTVFNEDVLESLKEPLRQEYETNGMTVDSIDYFSNDQAVFFRTEGEIAGVKALVYYTVCNHQAISMVVRYDGDVMPEEYKTQLQAMVDSVRFDNVAAAPAEDIPEEEVQTDVEAAAQAAAEETADEIEAAAEALEEETAPAESLISPAAEAEDVPAAPAKKKGFPVLPVVLGGVAVGAIAGAVASRSKKKKRAAQQQPTYAVPATPFAPAAPAAPTAPVSPASAAVAGAAAPIAQAATPAAPVVSAAPVVPPAPVVPAAPVVPPAPVVPAAPVVSAAPVVPAAPDAPAKRTCAACGADLGPDEKFCPFCGTKAE